MKKLISFSLFIGILLLTVAASSISAEAQMVMRGRMLVPPGAYAALGCHAGGHWRWSRKLNQYVWVQNTMVWPRFHRRTIRVRYF
jgi:hypothetical protein